MLKSTLIFALAIASALANEDGYYHKQYQYKSSSSSYKNNELQHKTDDEEFSSIHGDLAGRQDPKVDQYSQHTEYKNPNTQTDDTHGTGTYQSNLGTSGLESSSALRGSTGYTGNSGYAGSSGYTGSTGYHGTSGYTGSAGYQGASGYHGSAGVQGSTGLHGSSGYRGSTGLQGTTGYQGVTGQQGSTGYQGMTGQQGSTGYPGITGQQGSAGYQGVTGQQGTSGYERSSSYERSSTYQGSASTQNANQYPYGQHPTTHQEGITGQRNTNAYTGTYHMAGATQLNRGQYDTQSNLYDISQRLQTDLSRQLAEALTRRSTYGSTRETEMQALEAELRTNVTRQLQEELQRQYGSQTRRGGYSYPQSTGHYSPQANYNTQELDDYTQQVQTNLLGQLKDEYKTSSSYSSESSYNQKTGYAGTYRPYVRSTTPKPEPVIRPSTPLLELTTQVQHDLDTELNTRLRELQVLYFNDNTYKSRNQPDFDVILENLLSEVRRNLTTEMEHALRNAYGIQEEQDGYFFSTWNVNANVANYKKDRLNDLKTQVEKGLVKKITDSIKDQKTRYYEERRTYQSRQTYSESQTYESRPRQTVMYPGNQYSSSHASESSANSFAHQRPAVPHSYNLRGDYNSQSQRDTSYGHTGIYSSSTPRSNRGDQQQVEEFDYQYSPTAEQRPVGYKPNSDSLTQGVYSQPAGNAYRSQSTNSESSYQYLSGQRQTGMEYTPSASTHQVTTQELANIRNELTEDLSQQVRNAIWDQQRQSGYTSSSRQPASTQVVNDLSEEFKRNFSRKVEDVLKQHGVRGGYSFSVSTSGNLQNGQNNQRLLDLTNKLQDDLLRQLREGLTEQSSSSVLTSAYGTSKKSYGGHYTANSGFREVDYASDSAQQTEDCMQSDEASQKLTPPIIEANPERHQITNPNVDLTSTNMEMTQQLEDQQSIDDQNQEVLSQNYDNFDQQTSLVDFPEQSSADLNQQIEDLTQQTEDFDASDLNQRSEDFNQRTEVFGPKTADLDKLARSQNQELLSQTSTENVDNPTQKVEKLSSLYSENTGHSREPTTFHYSPRTHEQVVVSGLDDIDELQQKTTDYLQVPENMDSYQSQNFPLFSAQPIGMAKKLQSTEASDFDSQKMEDVVFQQHIAVEDEIKTEITDDFEQKHTPHYQANVVQDVAHQQQKFHSPVFEKAESEETMENLQHQTVQELENNNATKATTETPEVTSKSGFWSKLGGKISDSLKKAKDKVQAIG